MVGVKSICIRYRFFIATAIVLFASFAFNLFGVGDSEKWFFEFQKDSSFLVEKVSLCKGEQHYYAGILNYSSLETRGSTSCKEQDNVPYAPQFGLQARVISLFSPADKEKLRHYFSLVTVILAGMSALIMALIVVRTRKLFGTVAATVLIIGACLSPWLAAYSHNMYWVFVTVIAPFAFVYCCYPWFKARKMLWMMHVVIFLLILLRLLNGYEHVTTVVISVMAAFTIYEYRGVRKASNKLFVNSIVVGCVAALAFMCALGLNVVGLNEYYKSPERSIEAIQNRADARGSGKITNLQPDVITGLKYTLPEVYQVLDYYAGISRFSDGKAHPVYYATLSVLNYSLLPAINYPLRSNSLIWTVLQSIVFFAVIGFVVSIKVAHQKKQRDYSLVAAMFVSLMGAISWLVLMPGHAYPHAHLNAIVFYIPFLILCYIAIGSYVGVLINRIKLYVSQK